MNGASKALRFFFWFAFAAFLLASIPHVAYFFRAYEPVDASLDVWYWSVATFIAVSIDVTIFLLSVTVAGLRRQKKGKGLIASIWFFIIVLAGLSWYINDRYALHFINTSMISATPVVVPFSGVIIPDINPLIASCFQVLAIAYTWISDKIAADESPKTAEQLKAEADELELVTIQRQRIAAMKRENTVRFTTGLVDAGVTVFGHVKSKGKKPDVVSLPDMLTSTSEESEERQTDEFEVVKTVFVTSESSEENGFADFTEGCENEGEKRSQSMAWDGLRERSTVTIEEAAKLLECEPKYVRTLRTRGNVKAAPRNSELILVSSVKAYLNGKGKTRPVSKSRRSEPQLSVVKSLPF